MVVSPKTLTPDFSELRSKLKLYQAAPEVFFRVRTWNPGRLIKEFFCGSKDVSKVGLCSGKVSPKLTSKVFSVCFSVL